MIKTVGEMLDALILMDRETPIKLFVDDGCGCCSSGGDFEEIELSIEDGEIHLR